MGKTSLSFFLVFLGFIVLFTGCIADLEKVKLYKAAFEEVIITNDIGKNKFDYCDQNKLYIVEFDKNDSSSIQYAKLNFYPNRAHLISSKYKSEKPEDVGGLVLLAIILRDSANYGGGLGVSVFEYNIQIYDPYNNKIIAEQYFANNARIPSSTSKNIFYYPDKNEVKKWINDTWYEYILNRN